MSRTFLYTLTLLVILLAAIPAQAVKCIWRDGELVLEDGISYGPFDCMPLKQEKKSMKLVHFDKMTPDGPTCTVSHRIPKKVPTKYAKSDIRTGSYCKYKCVDDKQYKCLYSTRSKANCPCQLAGPRVVTVPVVGGKGPDALGETCDNKWEGYEFADAVACTRMRGEFKKERLVEIGERKCVKKVETIMETRYMRTEKTGKNLQGCVYVCKKALLKCTGMNDGKKCKCGRIGLRKVLVGMDEGQKEGRVDQTKCKGGDCGPCGNCNSLSGECELKKHASKGNYCDCGEICPDDDRRKNTKGGKIYCEPNWRLKCRSLPKWMREEEPGTKNPDLCTSGKVDAADRCGCAKGYKEFNAKYGSTKCRKV